jgi:hypothetical protein
VCYKLASVGRGVKEIEWASVGWGVKEIEWASIGWGVKKIEWTENWYLCLSDFKLVTFQIFDITN